ncbi:MAG TPA: MBL fold metallo-hydrolase [Gaiellaceae bacterium]|jgi:glyoxylase-like metal-dependent hydrolase (beta-lactamase superfamily II)/rhodanese-related sulfurtransferase
MLFRQFVDEDLGCASYLVGDTDAGEALLVDPAYAIEQYLGGAEQEGVRIVRVLETHTHADHVSGHGRLALEHGIPVSVHADAGAAYPHDALADGDEIAAGAVKARTIHTPGHRPEHCCFLVDGALLTGDSLFVGTVARPDLAVEAREGAEGMFHSLRRLLDLSDDVRVFPGHVAGSLCGTGMSPEHSTTIGAERRGNPLLALATVTDFVDETAGASTPRPPNMERIVELNRGSFLGGPPALGPVSAPDHATVLDVRSADDFAAGHVPGALNVPVAVKGFGTRTGFVLRRDEPVVLHASSPDEAEVAAGRLRAVGILELEGYLDGPQELEPLATIEVGELAGLLHGGDVDVIDVRELDERDSGFIPGSKHVPYRLLRAYGAAVAGDKPVVTVCESGARAAVAASVLVAAGVDARPVLHGGIPDWHRAGGHTVEFRRCGS